MDIQELKPVFDQKKALLSGNAAKVSEQHAAGKLTARERIAKLLDAGSFVETDTLLASDGNFSGVVTGYGTVEERPVYVVAQDYTVHGGAMSASQAKKINKILSLAEKTGAPVICMCDSAGVKIDEGALAMNAFASVYAKMVRISGVCPIISMIMGPVIGGAAMISQLSDLTVQVRKIGQLMVYGPTVVGSLTGKNLKAEDVGGADAMLEQGGISVAVDDEEAAVSMCVKLLNLLPGSNMEAADIIDTDDMNRVITGNANVTALMQEMADCGDYVELNAGFGSALHIALCRIGGHTVGMVCSDADAKDGMLDAASSLKAARFIRFCDSFDLPVVSMINSKGVMVPDEKHQAETLKAASSLLYAYAEATTAKISVITGNAIGQSYITMAGKDIADMTYAWPEAVISALTPEAAVQVLYTDELKNGTSRFQLETAFRTEKAGVINAATQGLIDDVCEPAETRKYVIAALEMLNSKCEGTPDKKHGNMPL